ncbi:hypothetical protein ACFFX1_39980 [Dactylosporangium sucinum]|nr:hypothetical protein [Dactylosporangium sucinum]
MRDKMLGRWMFRLAVTIGAGSVALGLPAAAAHADDLRNSGRVAIPGAVQIVGTPIVVRPVSPGDIAVTEDFGWG